MHRQNTKTCCIWLQYYVPSFFAHIYVNNLKKELTGPEGDLNLASACKGLSATRIFPLTKYCIVSIFLSRRISSKVIKDVCSLTEVLKLFFTIFSILAFLHCFRIRYYPFVRFTIQDGESNMAEMC